MKALSIFIFSFLFFVSTYGQMDSVSAKMYSRHLNSGRILNATGYTILGAGVITVIAGINKSNHSRGGDLHGAATAGIGILVSLVSIPFFIAGSHEKHIARKIKKEQGRMSLSFIKDGMGKYQTAVQFKINI